MNDTSQPIETKLAGVNMRENMEEILKICVFRRYRKSEKILFRLINYYLVSKK